MVPVKKELTKQSFQLQPSEGSNQLSTQIKKPSTSPMCKSEFSANPPVIEVQTDSAEEATFDPKGKSISTGRTATGWL